MTDEQIEIWNKAILASMREIMICRCGMPGPYYGDVKRLLIVNDDDDFYTKLNKIVKDFEDKIFKELDEI